MYVLDKNEMHKIEAVIKSPFKILCFGPYFIFDEGKCRLIANKFIEKNENI